MHWSCPATASAAPSGEYLQSSMSCEASLVAKTGASVSSSCKRRNGGDNAAAIPGKFMNWIALHVARERRTREFEGGYKGE